MAENNSVTSTVTSTAQSVQEEFSKDTQGCFVAAILMLSFAVSLLWGFGQVSYIIYKILESPTATPADRSSAIKDAIQILMTIGTLFSPLLAFVLGYYFNQSQHARIQVDRSGVTSDVVKQPDR